MGLGEMGLGEMGGHPDLQGVKISVFPLTLLVIVTTVLPLPRSL